MFKTMKTIRFGVHHIINNINKIIVAKKRKVLISRLYSSTQVLPLFKNRRVLCWEPAPFPIHTDISSSLGTALALRGCEVEQIICDGTPVACVGREIVDRVSFADWPKVCPGCYQACKYEAGLFGLKTIPLGSLISTDVLQKLRGLADTVDVNEISSFHYQEVNVGKYATSSLIRYYKGKIVEPEENLLREYLYSALVITEAAVNKIESFKPDAIYMSHGIYTLWGPAMKIGLQRGIPVIKMGGGYLPSFTHFRKIVGGENMHQGVLSDSGWEARKTKALKDYEEDLLNKYMEKRYNQGGADISFINRPIRGKDEISRQLKIDSSKPIWCIFPNLVWDAALDLAPIAFKTPTEWLVETIKVIMNKPNVQWLIKAHPAEAATGTVQGAQAIIDRHFPKLPSNIKIIPTEANINTMDIYNLIDGGITLVGNTIGLELTLLGKPLIVAGETIFAKKGFTYDGFTPAEYLKYLNIVPDIPALTLEQRENARKLAYSFFIQRNIPLRMFKRVEKVRFHSVDWEKVELLSPSKDPVIDLICERFFEGEDFILPDEVIHEVSKLWKET